MLLVATLQVMLSASNQFKIPAATTHYPHRWQNWRGGGVEPPTHFQIATMFYNIVATGGCAPQGRVPVLFSHRDEVHESIALATYVYLHVDYGLQLVVCFTFFLLHGFSFNLAEPITVYVCVGVWVCVQLQFACVCGMCDKQCFIMKEIVTQFNSSIHLGTHFCIQ